MDPLQVSGQDCALQPFDSEPFVDATGSDNQPACLFLPAVIVEGRASCTPAVAVAAAAAALGGAGGAAEGSSESLMVESASVLRGALSPVLPLLYRASPCSALGLWWWDAFHSQAAPPQPRRS
ncbi:hypothetical protein O3P69_019849 [Scylla paramamosain]|uniref:Uncharacterized protein n=1 Tax=Scylla paramamosain TaxID=85552 RepID=A0AAW0SDE7_SCYPA